MNKVYISGKVVQQPQLLMEGDIPHLIMAVRVTHKKRNGERRSEDYRVNAWNGVAKRGKEKLAKGQFIAVQGYLTQNASNNHATEITVEEFLPLCFGSSSLDMEKGSMLSQEKEGEQVPEQAPEQVSTNPAVDGIEVSSGDNTVASDCEGTNVS